MNDGKLAEIKAIQHYTEFGYEIFLPFGGNGSCDFIAQTSDILIRVEVKSTTSKSGNIELRRRNGSKHSERKLFESAKSDKTFLMNLTTGSYVIKDSKELESRSGITI